MVKKLVFGNVVEAGFESCSHADVGVDMSAKRVVCVKCGDELEVWSAVGVIFKNSERLYRDNQRLRIESQLVRQRVSDILGEMN